MFPACTSSASDVKCRCSAVKLVCMVGWNYDNWNASRPMHETRTTRRYAHSPTVSPCTLCP